MCNTMYLQEYILLKLLDFIKKNEKNKTNSREKLKISSAKREWGMYYSI